MKCDNCNDKVDFIIDNIKKERKMYFCSLHFWIFCKRLGESWDLFKESIPQIEKIIKQTEEDTK